MASRLPSGSVNAETYLHHLRLDTARIGEILSTTALDTPVPSCPGWDLARLAGHLGGVERWAAEAVSTGAAPSSRPHRPERDDELIEWVGDSAGLLLAALEAADPDAPAWHPFPGEQVNRVWFRRQAHEHAVHRWDAEQAAGSTSPLDPELSSDGIDEYLEVGLERLRFRDGIVFPSGSLHLHCTDVAGEWLVRVDADGGLQLRRAHEKGDAAIRGPAEAILLALWGRDSSAGIDVIGDASVAEAWLGLPGI
jgi:uncharacterized protein (TIGR03083 family)